MYKELLKAVTNIGSPSVLLVGDFLLDSYIYGDALRISPEAPVPVLKVVDKEYRCGGAGSVAADLVALGARCIGIGTIGKDKSAEQLLTLLNELKVDTSGILQIPDRPTISKQRLVGLAQHRHRQQLLRIDEESLTPLTSDQEETIISNFQTNLKNVDIVCLQDYNKGLLSNSLCKNLIKLAKKASKKVLVDPPPVLDYSKFAGASIITPNRKEASLAAGFSIETIKDARKAADSLKEKLKLDAIVITLDNEGAFLKTDDICEHIPTIPRSVYDVTGAGDMVLAVLAAALAAGCDYKTAVQIANIAGGIEVEKFGAATVTIDEIVNEIIAENRGKMGKVRQLNDLVTELSYRRQQKEIIVFTNGCFDVLHRGHIEYLKFCKIQGDIVVIGLNSDSSVKQIKGPQRPLNNQHDRAAVLAALESVDYIVVFDDPDPLKTIVKIQPDILVKGADWKDKGVIGREFVEGRGGKVILAPMVDGKSTTKTIKKIQSLKQDEE